MLFQEKTLNNNLCKWQVSTADVPKKVSQPEQMFYVFQCNP